MKKLILLLTLVAGVSYAGSVNFLAGTWFSPAVSMPVVSLRSGVQPVGATTYRMYGVRCPGAQAVTYPPTTNDFSRYVNVTVGEMVNANDDQTTPYYIHSRLGGSYRVAQTGWYYRAVAGNNGENGYFHVFSAETPTNAAWYYNTSIQPFATTPVNNNGAGTINQINPAYKQLHIEGLEAVSNAAPGTGWWPITGQVHNVSSAGGDNTLDQDAFIVWWRLTQPVTTAWSAIDAFAWIGDGGFTGRYSGGSEMIVAPIGGANQMPNSMLIGSQGPVPPVVVAIPEPAGVLVGLAMAFLLKKR